jgi:mannan endo-1,4-beta-mannosidase
MRKTILVILAALMLLIVPSCKTSHSEKDKFITTGNGQFIRNGKPYYYIGTNYWYGAILGSTGKEGNRERLLKELDMMKANGIDNLRILAGAEGPDGEPRRVTPALQQSPGVYNEDLLNGLDFLLSEMAKRDMVAILFINNAWEWSGGFAQYLAWSGKGPIPYPETNGHTWGEFMSFSGTFHQCDECKELFRNHIRFLLGRTNKVNGIKYTEDPTIMTWEIANEPRAFSDANKIPMLNWINETAALIKSLDPNHLVTTGTEGSWGCEVDMDLFEKIHSSKDVDYLTMHIWPYNWSWLKPADMAGTIDKAIENTGKYMDEHMAVARKLNKPLVFEEFGLPRDGFTFTPGSPVTLRNRYYDYSFSRVLESAGKGDVLAAANFWTFSGTGLPDLSNPNHMWKPGDDYLGDPPQEAQGLNSVFITDSTMQIVKTYNQELKSLEIKEDTKQK